MRLQKQVGASETLHFPVFSVLSKHQPQQSTPFADQRISPELNFRNQATTSSQITTDQPLTMMLDSMMPTTSQHSSCGCLKPLTQVEMFPARYSQGMATMTSLRKIEAIQINRFVERDDAVYYVVDVFLQKPESRIPTNNRSKQSKSFVPGASDCAGSASLASARKPDFQVERRFSEFTKLRSAVYRLAQTSHSLLRCQFCNDVVNSILLSSSQPKRFMNLVFTRNMKTRILHKFVNSLTEMTLRSKKNNGCRECKGQEQIPQLLFAFLQSANSDDAQTDSQSAQLC